MTKLVIPEKVITNVTGRAIPKPADDQNTDDIIPGRYLIEITFKNMGSYVYFDERFKDGNKVESHPFNDPRYKEANILIAGANYGCGSSREHAPQALHRYGVEAIIAESFAEIFAGNCASLGIVGVNVPIEDIAKLAEYVQQKPSTQFDLNLADKVIRYDGDNNIRFNMPKGRRQAFLNGTWDAMAVLQQNEAGIKKIEKELHYLSFE